jgi:hypothetical protein
MGKRSSGFIYFCIFVYQQIFEMKNISLNDTFFLTYFIDGKTFVWISLILDDTFFFLAYFLEGKTVRSVVHGWLQSHI